MPGEYRAFSWPISGVALCRCRLVGRPFSDIDLFGRKQLAQLLHTLSVDAEI
jgi:hypothetical protein